eukprot:TRINITY_DN20_c0_g1_i17.p2 TRINITY_DN20_c0_g1~~TRINITY_DN20_c0_g1_i17.p2  ORF type:complete len:341 (-),score=115.84 TRINITY_DN20_c0_g1_i17:1087-2109(-)
MAVTHVTSNAQLDALLSERTGAITVVYFWAEWCEPCKHMQHVVMEMAKTYNEVACVAVEAEEIDEVAERFQVASVPSFLVMKGKAVIDSLVGADASRLVEMVEKALKDCKAAADEDNKPPLETRLRSLVNHAPVMLFMKGTPDAPQCGFSKKIVAILKDHSVPFSSFNILSDNEVRQGLKTFSDWPTYPQLYGDGKLIGGLDVVKEMAEEGELAEALAPAVERARRNEEMQQQTLHAKLSVLVSSAPVMLFMKGTPEAPQCGFSNKIVAILNESGVVFSHFDILTDPEVRQGLKAFSNWPTYPQLYADGKLVGGLDVVNELAEGGELLPLLPEVAWRHSN